MIDVQEAFRKAVPDFERIARATATLVAGRRGGRDPDRRHRAVPAGARGDRARGAPSSFRDGVEPIEKVVFSAAEAEGFDLGGRDQALVCGIETHVCVNQTVLDLLAEGVEVHVAEDAVGSRFAENKQVGLQKMERAGAVVTSVETALFELVGRAGTDEFKRGPEADPRVRAEPGCRGEDGRPARWRMPGYLLLEDGTRLDGELVGARRERLRARSSSTPR